MGKRKKTHEFSDQFGEYRSQDREEHMGGPGRGAGGGAMRGGGGAGGGRRGANVNFQRQLPKFLQPYAHMLGGGGGEDGAVMEGGSDDEAPPPAPGTEKKRPGYGGGDSDGDDDDGDEVGRGRCRAQQRVHTNGTRAADVNFSDPIPGTGRRLHVAPGFSSGGALPHLHERPALLSTLPGGDPARAAGEPRVGPGAGGAGD
jgi:hypothetical protein